MHDYPGSDAVLEINCRSLQPPSQALASSYPAPADWAERVWSTTLVVPACWASFLSPTYGVSPTYSCGLLIAEAGPEGWTDRSFLERTGLWRQPEIQRLGFDVWISLWNGHSHQALQVPL